MNQSPHINLCREGIVSGDRSSLDRLADVTICPLFSDDPSTRGFTYVTRDIYMLLEKRQVQQCQAN
jgi:hypothetical protein